MANIQYDELKNDVLDRLNAKVGQVITEEDRQLLQAPQRLAKAASESLLKFCRLAEASSVPDLVDEIDLTKARNYNKVNAYQWPEANFAEREDKGILSIILSSREMDWNEAIPLSSVEYRANSVLYGKKNRCFAVDDFKRRFYVPEGVNFSLLIFRIPHSVRAASSGEYRGASLQVTAGASSAGDITISDGTNSLAITVANGDTPTQVATKIIDDVNAAATFYYNAKTDPASNDTVLLYHRYDMPLDLALAPTFTDTGGTSVTATITDVGTIELPVGLSYIDELAEIMLSALLSPKLGQASTEVTDSETESATPA